MKLKAKNKFIGIFLCFIFLINSIQPMVLAADTPLSDDIVILYTNDVHSYIDGELSYDVIAEIKDDLQTKYKNVFLVDAGDHIQGTAYGSMDKGESVIKLMNAADYDVATLGNHEFDYHMEGCMNAIGWAEFSYVSCNFYHEADGVRGENVLDRYSIFDCGDEKIAFVGITTPETFSKSSPIYFQDAEGNFIYGISGGDDGAELYADVQNAINDAKAAGATKVIALGHLGVDASSGNWTSEKTIENVTGLHAFIDGHSHTVMEGRSIIDKGGNEVILTQTGEYFDRIGMMIIDSDTGAITTDFIEYDQTNGQLLSDLYDGTALLSDESVKTIKDEWMTEIDELLGQKIGSTSIIFDNYDENGNRLVRSQETNTGDFAADALYYLFDDMGLDVDLAVMNGGGIRNQAITGDLTYKLCKDIHTFGNVACLQTVTGQQILDMLEWGARHAGESESGSFLHVSGITYKVDTSIPNTTKADERDSWIGGPSSYRVYDVKVYDKEDDVWYLLERDAEYNLAGYNYTLRDLGDGFAMLNDAVNVLDYVMEDYMVLANYIEGFENGVIDAKNSPLLSKYPGLLIDYGSVYGSGRIEVVTPSIRVGGVEVTKDNAADVFGDGRVSYNAATNTLTLNGYVYEGDGFIYDTYENEKYERTEYYSAAIYSSTSLNIELIGNNILKNTFNGKNTQNHGNGIIAENKLVIKGDGSLTVEGFYALEAHRELVIDGCMIDVDSESTGIASFYGSMYIKNGASVWIDSQGEGIYVWDNFTLTDSTLNINSGIDGIYSYDGVVTIDSTSVKVHETNPTIVGTSLSIKAADYCGIFAYRGIVINDKLALSSPENAEIKKIYNKKYDYWYYTIGTESSKAKEIVIEPLGYHVTITGGDFNMEVLVPAGMSINEAYCEVFGIDDFSEIIAPAKEGYSFGGCFTDELCSYGNEFSFNDDKIVEDITVYTKWNVSPSTIDQIIADLEKVEKELADAIVSGDASLDEKISALSAALKEAIESGDASLDEKISALSAALQEAISAYQAADDSVKAELIAKIEAAYAALDEAIKEAQKDMDDMQQDMDELKNALEKADADNKNALEAKDKELEKFITIVCVISGVTFCISIVFGIWFCIDKRKKGKNF